MEYGKEINEIGRIIASMSLLDEIRRAVSEVSKNGFVVTDGKHYASDSKYDIVVKCGSENRKQISRRIKTVVSNVNIEKIAEDVLGINMARRTRG